jgi:hypothetical protein
MAWVRIYFFLLNIIHGRIVCSSSSVSSSKENKEIVTFLISLRQQLGTETTSFPTPVGLALLLSR